MTKTITEFRKSGYHNELGRKMCAAFIAQQQGVSLNTAFEKVPDPIADVWLVVAEFARQAAMQNSVLDLELERRRSGPVM